MPVRKPKPTSPGLRFVSYSDFAEITKVGPEKTLTEDTVSGKPLLANEMSLKSGNLHPDRWKVGWRNTPGFHLAPILTATGPFHAILRICRYSQCRGSRDRR